MSASCCYHISCLISTTTYMIKNNIFCETSLLVLNSKFIGCISVGTSIGNNGLPTLVITKKPSPNNGDISDSERGNDERKTLY